MHNLDSRSLRLRGEASFSIKIQSKTLRAKIGAINLAHPYDDNTSLIMEAVKEATHEAFQSFEDKQTSYNLNYRSFMNEISELKQDIKKL